MAAGLAATFLLTWLDGYWAGWGAQSLALAWGASSAVLLLSASAASSALRIRDPTTIASFRRALAVMFASQMLWLVLALVGDGYSVYSGSGRAFAGAMAFGALTCAGFELLVIGGAFTRSAPLSAVLSAIHPLGTFAVAGLPLAPSVGAAPVAAGAVMLAVVAAFTPLLRRNRTSRGDDAVELFQAFMKTWTGGNAADLESIIEGHSEPAQVTTKVMRFRRADGDAYIVLPGVHPGPFYPVGSYNLPGLIAREFRDAGPVLTLHRPGGHERNLASSVSAGAYAAAIREFALDVGAEAPGVLRGPLASRIGKATASATAFGDDALLTLSFAPLGSDDLEPAVEGEMAAMASGTGLSVSVVDAHNSIGTEVERPDTADPGWADLFSRLKQAPRAPLKMAYAHSSEVGFAPGEDITENGVGLLLLESAGRKSALVLADANNSVPALHEAAARALETAGYGLVEFCTSDSHDLAARGMTVSRGYKALGEGTPVGDLCRAVVDMARLADTRLAPAAYGSAELSGEVKVFGSGALEEFARITASSSALAKRYSKLALASLAVLFVVALAA